MSTIKGLLLTGDGVNGTGTADNIMKWQDADTATNSVIYDDGTNVGIGTSSPAFTLDVNGVINVSAGNAIRSGGEIMIRKNGDELRVGSGVATEYTALYGGGTERMRIDSSGNVGIGTSNPAGKLSVLLGETNLSTASAAATTGYPLSIRFTGGASDNNLIRHEASANPTAYYTLIGTRYEFNKSFVINNKGSEIITYSDSSSFGLGLSGGASNLIRFDTNGSERLRIDSAGNVGIGTSSPVGVATAATTLHIRSTSNTRTGAIRLDCPDASINSYFYTNSEELKITTTTAHHIGFYTSDAQRMRITSGGDVLIGTTAIPTGTTGGTAFINGSSDRNYLRLATTSTVTRQHILFVNPNGTVGTIATNGSSTAYNTSSDYRLKENVVEMTGALDRVDALKPSRFNFIADPETTVDGFLAHEVQTIVPEAITGEKDEVDEEGNPIYQGIDQSKLVPLLVGAIQELRAEIELLKANK